MAFYFSLCLLPGSRCAQVRFAVAAVDTELSIRARGAVTYVIKGD